MERGDAETIDLKVFQCGTENLLSRDTALRDVITSDVMSRDSTPRDLDLRVFQC